MKSFIQGLISVGRSAVDHKARWEVMKQYFKLELNIFKIKEKGRSFA